MTILATISPLIRAALAAVDPAAAVARHMRRVGDVLHVDGRAYDLNDFEKVFVVGAGKAGAPMTQAVEEILGDRITEGCVVVKYDHQAPTRIARIRQAAHPVPDEAGLAAGAEALDIVSRASARDLVICLISGGGSALLESLPPDISLADLQTVTDLLLASGATIHEINVVRKHMSLVKGGRLAQAAHPAPLIGLILSDVVGNPLDIIASGPTVPDPSTWADAWAVIERYHLANRLPASVRERLQAGLRGQISDTPKPGDPLFERVHNVIVADNAAAAEAARDEAQKQGRQALILSTFVEGEAREVAKVVAALAREVLAHGRPLPPPACLILGGETTVTLGERPGRGGRNQELALAAALQIEGLERVTIVSLATDGTDGPTDAAGGAVDGRTAARGAEIGLDARTHLDAHNAYPYLKAVGALLQTGPTRTNVNDLIFVLVDKE